jgi:hypothetical protein
MQYDKRHVGLGEKPDDRWAVPLTHECHMAQHNHGNEISWWTNHRRKDPFALAIRHYRLFKRSTLGAVHVVGRPRKKRSEG